MITGMYMCFFYLEKDDHRNGNGYIPDPIVISATNWSQETILLF